MANVIIKNQLTHEQKRDAMRVDAAFDVADNDAACVPDLDTVCGIKGRSAAPKVPKVFLSNDCIFNCAYCGCRCTRDKDRYANTPAELAKFSVMEAKTNGNGVFVTSAIYKNADYTEELIVETLKIIRNEYDYKGYLHAKIMPGADPILIREAGKYANRLSVNIEVAKSEGYDKIAKQKNKTNILKPMGQISDLIANHKPRSYGVKPHFATSQTTQLMAGSTDENDRTIMLLSNALYKKYNLARVYYTGFTYRDDAVGYAEMPHTQTPKWRVARLYQADRLLKLYGFGADDILPEKEPFLDDDLDPKAAFALRNMHLFPVEVNTADPEMLLRIPGIGLTFSRRIMEARKYCKITFDVLRAIGVSLKRARHFITCCGKMENGIFTDENMLRKSLVDGKATGQLSMEF